MLAYYTINLRNWQAVFVVFYKKINEYKKRSACAAERKSVNPLLAGGCAACRLSLSVQKQTSPIGIDHLEGAPYFTLWIKIIRTPNTADRLRFRWQISLFRIYIIHYMCEKFKGIAQFSQRKLQAVSEFLRYSSLQALSRAER